MDNQPIPKPVHGGLNPAELHAFGLGPDQVIDFSSSINPLGPPPTARQVLMDLDLSSYPDPQSTELRTALSATTGVASGQIVAGNGSTELIHLLGRCYLKRGANAVILGPTFGEYEAACILAQARIEQMRAHENAAFHLDIPAVCRRIRDLKPKLVFLCNPNNPTGVYLDKASVEAVQSATDNGLLLIDEAYISFVDHRWSSLELLKLGNVVILRSMTKDYALTALRLGYALCPPEIAGLLFLNQPSWSVNGAAQACGAAALEDDVHLSRARQCVRESKEHLSRELRSFGLEVLPSDANFLLVKVGEAADLRNRLLAKGICVRDCSSFGLPQYIRVAALTLEKSRKLVQAIAEVLINV